MSFSSKVKKELAGHISNATHCRIAEIAAIISMCGSVLIDVDEKYSIRVRTETDSTAYNFCTSARRSLELLFPIYRVPSSAIKQVHSFSFPAYIS